MANINQPQGLKPVYNADGTPYNGGCHRYFIPAADVARYQLGKAVISLANADARGVPGVIVAVAGSTIRGVIVGIEPGPAGPNAVSLSGAGNDVSVVDIPATKTRDYYVYVADNPHLVFEMQGDATATNQVAANANKNAQMTVTDPAAGVPYSASVINSGTIATTQAHNLKLCGLVPNVSGKNNEFGAFARWLVRINQHELMGNTAGI